MLGSPPRRILDLELTIPLPATAQHIHRFPNDPYDPNIPALSPLAATAYTTSRTMSAVLGMSSAQLLLLFHSRFTFVQRHACYALRNRFDITGDSADGSFCDTTRPPCINQYAASGATARTVLYYLTSSRQTSRSLRFPHLSRASVVSNLKCPECTCYHPLQSSKYKLSNLRRPSSIVKACCATKVFSHTFGSCFMSLSQFRGSPLACNRQTATLARTHKPRYS